ncbi:thioredoxin family protein [Psychroflexus sp. YR1-1]|uniref:Thioredoxin family protein n=1 Tax=Psychroflexus aurantiacus TaxID=2709310 RepID=A0A6B3QX65_9FLAO|nr:thioredoxin family protein [Psychroflexus aurantiacus]NEV92589.1 thioredoxin family protein [Psychroflexus aurantiacus]
MTKFGELIDEQKPILLNFFADWSEDCENIHDQLKDVSAAVGDKAKLIKIDAEKNAQLVEALKVKKLPTYMLYKGGEMVWRQSGKLEANDLIILLEDNS